MRLPFLSVLWLGLAAGQLEQIPIGFIDFYGLNGLDADHLRSVLTVRTGDPLKWPQTRDQIQRELTKEVGRPFTHFSPVCCDKQGRLMLYIGFATNGEAVPRTRPKGDAQLPAELTTLYSEFIAVLPEALKNAPGLPEDYSKGYSLSSYAPMRAIQMRMRAAALANEALLLRVLAGAADDRQRIAAAHLAGYTRHSALQVAALVDASMDANESVRNNATRALGVLAAPPLFARGIPAESFVGKLNSPVWSDRNKALMLLTSLTRERDPKLLSALRRHALPALIEMARWQNPGHSGGAIRLLGRIAGIEESTLEKLAEQGDGGPAIAALESTTH